MGSREDDDYWDEKYSNPPKCDLHGDDMNYDPVIEWWCGRCDYEDEIKELYSRG